ncbi:helix-turn-helix domain-containing protein [Galbibacter sp.]|jgi:AraC-like DNA-binding protein|uniref:helix-turn-helix domain-containing protein n=1 Tax=Galbibacter sp. TaxID=2918471 RepID=UPI003A92DA4C
MDKKRRDFINCEIINLSKLKENFLNSIANPCDSRSNSEFFSEYIIKKQFGKGRISLFNYQGLELQFSQFELLRDLVCYIEQEQQFLELSFMIEGEKIISMRGSADIIHESQEAYTVQNTQFKGYVRISGSRPFREFRIRLSKSYLQSRGCYPLPIFKSFNHSGVIHTISNEILEVLMSFELSSLSKLSGRLYAEAKIMELLALEVGIYEKGKVVVKGNSQDKLLKKLYNVRQLMLSNLDRNLSIREISREMAINEYLLKKEFKRVFGYSINEFYAKEKMSKAKELLKSTQLPIYEIAGEIGYKNATHFSAAFKRFYGDTPKNFRSAV